MTIAGGAASHIFAIAVWYAVFAGFHFDLLKFWVNLILPFGALALGFLGGCGFWFVARRVHQAPTAGLMVSATAIAILTQLTIRYLGYWTLTIDGLPIHRVIGFGPYMAETLGHARMRLGHGTGTIELGAFGPIMELAQVAAYAVSSFVFVHKLGAGPRCESCSRYLQKMTEGEVYTDGASAFSDFIVPCPAKPPKGSKSLKTITAFAWGASAWCN